MLAVAVAAFMQVAAVPPSGDSLTLAEALRHARIVRGQTAIAAARVATARGAFRVAGTIPNPVLSYSHTESTPRQHLSIDQSLDWLLQRAPDRQAASAGIDRAQADSAQLLAQLSQDVRLNFYRTRAALESEALAQTEAALADSLARLASARLAVGDISQFEQEQVVQEARRARRTLSEIRERRRVAMEGLAWVIGWTAETPPVPTDRLDTSLDTLPSFRARPDTVPALRVALADSMAASETARSRTRARLPLPSVQIGAEWDDPDAPARGALSTVGFAIPIPLWHHGSGALAQARAQAAEAAAHARETRLDVTRALREAQIHVEEAAYRARFARDTLVPAARQLSARALRAYQSGGTSVLPVLDALRSEREIALTAIQDLLAFQEAIAEWALLLGRTD